MVTGVSPHGHHPRSKAQERIKPFVGKTLIDQIVMSELCNGITQQRYHLAGVRKKLVEDVGRSMAPLAICLTEMVTSYISHHVTLFDMIK